MPFDSPSAPAPVQLRSIPGNRGQPDVLTSGGLGAIPRPLTSLVGRDTEVEAVRAMLVDGDIRLLTLTGPGGVGKTRLALRISEEVAPAFPDGVVFVPLAAIDEPDLVLPTIARALGLREDATRSLAELLTNSLPGRRLLLVLDNFEQVRSAATQLAALLAVCPDLVALVTSRVRLQVAGEQRFPVLPLALPAHTGGACASGDSLLAAIAASPAVHLFVARTQAIDPRFTLDADNALPIAAICRRVDGLPLAIELAAARSHLFAAAELLARLDPALPLLSHGPDDAPDRLRTMRDAIAWSYNLLAPREQILFRRLAIFVGGFTIEAAEHVLRAEPSTVGSRDGLGAEGDAQQSLLEGIASLVDMSLLVRTEEGGATRLGMLETIREYGLELLAASGEEATTRNAHAAYYLDLVERVEPDLYGGRDLVPVLDALEAEHANFRAALDHLLGAGNAAAALHLAGALAPFWLFHSHRSEGRRWLARALAVTRDRARQLPPDEQGGLEAARARVLGGAATLAFTQGDQELAAELARENLALRRRLGEIRGIATALNLLGAVERAQGAYDEAARYCEEAVALFEQFGDPGWLALARGNLGILAYRRGNLGQATALLEAAVAFYRQAGDRYTYGAAVALSDLALVMCDQGDLPRAAALFAESLTGWRAVGTKEGLADWLARVATLAVAGRNPGQASRLFGAAEALREAIGYAFEVPERERHERAMAAARATIGEATFAGAWAAGATLSLDDAIAEAINLASVVSRPDHCRSPAAATVLTSREQEIMRLLVVGASDKEIAATLGISRRTVSNHVTAIRTKFKAPSRAAAVAVAFRDHLA